MKKFLAVLLAFILFIPESIFAIPGAYAESAADELPPEAYALRWREDGTAEIMRVDIGDAQRVVIPSEIDGQTIVSIGQSAFQDRKNLVSVTIPDTVTSIGDYAFYGCEKLESLTLPNSLESIGYGAFSRCDSLKEARLPSSLQTLGDFAFFGCSELESVTIPDSLTSIGHGVFSWSNRLFEVIISPDHPAYAYGNYALTDKRDQTLVHYIGPIQIDYEVPQGIEKIGDDAFAYRDFKSIVLPQGVKVIGDRAFTSTNLGKIIIPDSVTSIGFKAFYSTKSLKSIRIPASVTEIGGNNFSWCNMEKIEVDPANPVFEMQDNMLINKAEHKLVFHLDLDRGAVRVPEGIEIIGRGAFENSAQMKDVILPDTVREIGEDAFATCNSLTTLSLPQGIQTIEGGLIRHSKSIRSITLPEGVKTLKNKAIYSCENLEEIIIPASVTEIGSIAIYDCPKLTCKVTEGSEAQKYCEKNEIRYEIQK